jgi:hypothetical protein
VFYRFSIQPIFILIHVSKKRREQIRLKKHRQDGLAVPGLKLNMPRHFGGKDSVFFDLRFTIGFWELGFAVSVSGSVFSVLRSPFYVLCSSFFIPQNAVGVAYL